MSHGRILGGEHQVAMTLQLLGGRARARGSNVERRGEMLAGMPPPTSMP